MNKYNVHFKRTELGIVKGIEANNEEEARLIAIQWESTDNLYWGESRTEIAEVIVVEKIKELNQ